MDNLFILIVYRVFGLVKRYAVKNVFYRKFWYKLDDFLAFEERIKKGGECVAFVVQ